MIKSFLKNCFVSLVAVVLITGGFFMSSKIALSADDGDADLWVTGIHKVNTDAQADGTYAHGWSWTFNVDVPNNETTLKMRFANFVAGSSTITAGSHIRFYSEQSTNAHDADSAITIGAADTYSSVMSLDPDADLSDIEDGRQIEITVEVMIPSGSAGGSYSTSYGIQTNALLVSTAAIAGITAPVLGETPTATISATTEYTATIGWNGTPSTFGPNRIYTATVTITPKTGYTLLPQVGVGLSGVPANFFTVAGSTATNTINSGVVSAVFPITAKKQLTITAPTLTGTKAYDGDTDAAVTAGDLVGIYGSDDVTVSAVATYDTADVGTSKTITIVYTLGGTDAARYTKPVNQVVSTAAITAVELTANIEANDKPYDGGTTATLDAQWVTGMVNSETDVTLIVGAKSFDNANIGTRTVTASTLSLGGSDAGNYVLAAGATATDTADITAVELTPHITAADKVYDGDATVTLSAQWVTGMVNSETDVTLIVGAKSFDSNEVGNDKTVTASTLSLGGTKAGNYVLATATATDTANITQKQLTIAAPTLTGTKAYDGDTDAAVTAGSLTNKVGSDDVTVSAVATYDNENIGTSKTITIVYTLGGTAAARYIKPVDEVVTTAAITAVELTASITAADKSYDGGTTATLSAQSVTGMVGGETVTLIVGSKSFADANVGTGILVTASDLSLGGADASNYVLAAGVTATDTADITAVELTPHITANNKSYDGGITATLSAQWVTGMVNGETDVTLTVGLKNFNNPNIGTRTVTASTLSLGGADASNYVLADGITTTDDAEITAVELTASITAADKSYDGGTTVTLSAQSVSGMVNSETDVTLVVGAKSFADANVGTGILVTASTLSLGGANSGNYVLAAGATATDTADITAASLASIGAITGTAQVGTILTAGALTPSGAAATATYQWQIATESDGEYSNIADATSSTYTPVTGNANKFIKVIATGHGNYTGSITSDPTAAVLPEPLTAIGAITGTAQVGRLLTAGAITPAGATATATYQWLRSNTSVGGYSEIGGATSSTYTLTAADASKYIHVTATGNGSYTGSIISDPTTAIINADQSAPSGLAGVAPTTFEGTDGQITGTTTLMEYKLGSGGSYSAASASPTTGLAAGTYYVRYAAKTGYNASSDTEVIVPIGLVSVAISGTAQVGSELSASSLTPSGASTDATYQWRVADTAGGEYSDIGGATSSTYTVAASNVGKFIKLVVTGHNYYSGSVTSAATAEIAPQPLSSISAITGTVRVNNELTAGTLTPSGATVSYQWQIAPESDGEYANIGGATTNKYTLVASDVTKFIKVVATGTLGYTGSVTSAATSAVSPDPLTSIGSISGTTQVGEELTAGTLAPSGATATYQWLRSNTSSGGYSEIGGATSSTYTLVSGDSGKYIKVKATGSGGYTGSTTSNPVGPISVLADGYANGSGGSKTIVYTLTTGTFSAAVETNSNWTLGGSGVADLGTVSTVVRSGGNAVATITITGTLGAGVYTVAPAQDAFTTGFTAPAAKTVSVSF